ncbi:MAG: L-dopachrome tautomerase-related protein, partial [Bacteroidota bacterium]
MKLPIMVMFLFLLLACSTQDPAAPGGDDTSQELQFIELFRSNDQWTGVAASHDERLFVCFPRWSPTLQTSVAEIGFENGVARSLVPYPDNEWNTWNASASPQDHFVCVQSIYVDGENAFWILDPANPMFSGVVQGGAKLLKLDLQTNRVIQTFLFDSLVAPAASYLNDIRVDTEHDVAYVTDSGLGAIIVVDLRTGVSRRVLYDHSSTKAERVVLTIDGRGWANVV